MAENIASVRMLDEEEYQRPDYRRSRRAYTMECAFEYFVSLLVADTFLAKLLKNIGIDDATIGIISSFITLAFLFQLASVFVVQRIRNIKRFVILFHTVGQLCFIILYLIPFMPFALPYRKVLVIASVLIAYFGNYFVTSMLYKWCNSFVHPKSRGAFSAVKEMISLATGVVATFVIASAMDAFEAQNNLEGGFIFAAVAILIFCICDLVCLLLVRRELGGPTEEVAQIGMREVFKNTLGNKSFRHVVVLVVLFDVARYMTIGFLGTYRNEDLLFALVTANVINYIGIAARFFLSRPFGRFADKYSYARGLELAMCLATVAFAFLVFTAPATRWLFIGYSLFYNVSQAGIVQNMHCIVYSYVDSRYFIQASAIKNSIGGLCGFGAALLGGRILSAVQANGNTVLGIPMYGQQLLAIISCAFLVAAILYNRFVISKQKVMIQ